MDIINPYYKLNNKNIFTIRRNEYASLLETIRKILIPAEELGFEVTDLRIKDTRVMKGEICRTLKQSLVLRFQKGISQIDLSMQIPKLVDDNYIIVNGRRKIPLFQLFDIPIVTRGKHIKIRTNVATIMIFEQRDPPYMYISILGRKLPMHLVVFGYYGLEVLSDRFSFREIDSPVIDENSTAFDKLLNDLYEYYHVSRGTTQDDIIKEIGRYYSKYNAKGKGEDLMYAFDLILKTDVMSAEFFKSGSILEDIFSVLQKGPLDDTDIRNKRIRCFEYVILSKISKAIFDMCMSNRTSRQPKFNINSTQIISECNVSDIIQFDFSINPIDELTKLSRISLVGPGGFNRQNVPEHLRNIMPTMFGRICPVDTPDRDNCGVLQNLIPNTRFNSDLQFTEDFLEKQPISIPVSMVPFLEHDDQTRLQMASSQMRQAIMLQKFDRPLVQSGCEGLYSHKTQFVKTAKKDGRVVYVDKQYMILIYDDSTVDVFDISYRKIYISNLDVLRIYVKRDDRVKAGQILAESNFCKDGQINIGKNLLTAVMEYYGYNYEDGIVISDRLQKEGVLTSVHFEDMSFTIPPNKVLLSLSDNKYKPLPEISDRISKGSTYCKIKDFPSQQVEYFDVFRQETSLLAKHNLIITESTIYANDWNKDIPEYKEWIEKKIAQQQEEEDKLKVILNEHLPKDEAKQFIRDRELDKFANTEKFKVKGERINGIEVELFGIYFRPIQVGDKIGNRHGNKGVISIIVPHEKMPQLPDGRHVDICINPLGIISRMNIGQVYELHLGMAVNNLKGVMKNILRGKYKEEIDETMIQKLIRKFLVDFIKIIDNTFEKWYSTQFEKNLPDIIDEKFIDDFSVIQAPFESLSEDSMKKALKYAEAQFKYKIYEPSAKETILNDIAVGYMYFFKMVHIAETRLAARGIGSYARKTLQPLAGRKHKGGQRCGEMETACLIGHDARNNLFEFLTTKSDCIDLKNAFIRDTIGSGLSLHDEDETEKISTVPESVRALHDYLLTIGVKV